MVVSYSVCLCVWQLLIKSHHSDSVPSRIEPEDGSDDSDDESDSQDIYHVRREGVSSPLRTHD